MSRMLNQLRAARVAVTAAVLLAFAAPAAAQGLYYKEITKDGRIYVFNIAANAERFEKSGEAGIGITKPGVGPNGETVIGDNERALQLYFFKHGISEAVPDPPQPTQSIVWRDGKTRITLDNYYLEISNRVQPRFTYEDPSDNLSVATPNGLAVGDSRASWRIRRAKFKLEGYMFRPWLSFETQLNYPNLNGSNIGSLLEDAAFDVDFSHGQGTFRVHVGQFKPPWGAQEMTSSGNQQFVDRTLVSNFFFPGRQTGIALWGATKNNKLEWRFGVFNGDRETRVANFNDQFQYTARVVWQPNGSQVLNQRAWVTGALYSEADFESTTVPIYALAVNWENQNFFKNTAGTTPAANNDQKWNAYSLDGLYKYKGFSAVGMYALGQRKQEVGDPFDVTGSYVQAGYLFSRRRLEVAIRYAQHDPNDAIDNNNVTETRGAFSYYYSRHVLKWQNDVGQVKTELPAGGSTKLWEFRSQLQFIF